MGVKQGEEELNPERFKGKGRRMRGKRGRGGKIIARVGYWRNK